MFYAYFFVKMHILDMTHNALFFATLKRRAGRISLEGSCFFDKN